MNPKSIELPAYLFHQGTNYRSQEFLGAHPHPQRTGLCHRVPRLGAERRGCVGSGGFQRMGPHRRPDDQNYRTGNLGVRDPQEETV